jgi:dTDP-4-dehydrorhamnose reductase
MAQWCASHQIPLIHFSTDYVFDGHGTRPWSEDDPTHPLSTYGATKLAGENQIRAAGGCFLIIRTSWIYAALGTNFLRKIAVLAKKHKQLHIVADQVGAPTSAALIAELLWKMLEPGLTMFRQRAAEAHGRIHLAAAGEASWHEFARQIIAGLRSRGVSLMVEEILPIPTLEYPLPAQRPLNSRLNLNRLQAVFGIGPPHWQEALEPELDRLAQELCR